MPDNPTIAALRNFYKEYHNGQAPPDADLEGMATRYAGKEKELWKKLYSQYNEGSVPDDATLEGIVKKYPNTIKKKAGGSSGFVTTAVTTSSSPTKPITFNENDEFRADMGSYRKAVNENYKKQLNYAAARLEEGKIKPNDYAEISTAADQRRAKELMLIDRQEQEGPQPDIIHEGWDQLRETYRPFFPTQRYRTFEEASKRLPDQKVIESFVDFTDDLLASSMGVSREEARMRVKQAYGGIGEYDKGKWPNAYAEMLHRRKDVVEKNKAKILAKFPEIPESALHVYTIADPRNFESIDLSDPQNPFSKVKYAMVDRYIDKNYRDLDEDRKQMLRKDLIDEVTNRPIYNKALEKTREQIKEKGLADPAEAMKQYEKKAGDLASQFTESVKTFRNQLEVTAQTGQVKYETTAKAVQEEIQAGLDSLQKTLQAQVNDGMISYEAANAELQAFKKDGDWQLKNMFDQYSQDLSRQQREIIQKAEKSRVTSINALEALRKDLGLEVEDEKIKASSEYVETFSRLFEENVTGIQMDQRLKMQEQYDKLDVGDRIKNAAALGYADMFDSFGGGLKWMGMYEAGNFLTDLAKQSNETIPVDDLGQFDSKDILKASWWIDKGVRMLPTTLTLMATGMGTTGAVTGTLARAGMTQMGRTLIGAAAGAMAMRPIEAFMEAGQKFNQDLEEGKDITVASKNASSMMRGNMALFISDFAQLSFAFGKLPLKVSPGVYGKIVKAGSTLGNGAMNFSLEGGEEVYQGYLQEKPDNPMLSFMEYAQSAQGIEAGVLGGISGLTLAAMSQNSSGQATAVHKLLTNYYQNEMKPTQEQKIDGPNLQKRYFQLIDTLKGMREKGVLNEGEFQDALQVAEITHNKVMDSLTGALPLDYNSQAHVEYTALAVEANKIRKRADKEKDPDQKQIYNQAIGAVESRMRELLNDPSSPIYSIDGVPVTEKDFMSLMSNAKVREFTPASKFRAENDLPLLALAAKAMDDKGLALQVADEFIRSTEEVNTIEEGIEYLDKKIGDAANGRNAKDTVDRYTALRDVLISLKDENVRPKNYQQRIESGEFDKQLAELNPDEALVEYQRAVNDLEKEGTPESFIESFKKDHAGLEEKVDRSAPEELLGEEQRYEMLHSKQRDNVSDTFDVRIDDFDLLQKVKQSDPELFDELDQTIKDGKEPTQDQKQRYVDATEYLIMSEPVEDANKYVESETAITIDSLIRNVKENTETTYPSQIDLPAEGRFEIANEYNAETIKRLFDKSPRKDKIDSTKIPGINNKYEPDKYHVYHGTNQVEIDQEGNLILKPSKNFDEQTESVSFTQVPATAIDYMIRKGGKLIVQIDNRVLPEHTMEGYDEVAVNTKELIKIPAGSYRVIELSSNEDQRFVKKYEAQLRNKPTLEVLGEYLEQSYNQDTNSEIAEQGREEGQEYTPRGVKSEAALRKQATLNILIKRGGEHLLNGVPPGIKSLNNIGPFNGVYGPMPAEEAAKIYLGMTDEEINHINELLERNDSGEYFEPQEEAAAMDVIPEEMVEEVEEDPIPEEEITLSEREQLQADIARLKDELKDDFKKWFSPKLGLTPFNEQDLMDDIETYRKMVELAYKYIRLGIKDISDFASQIGVAIDDNVRNIWAAAQELNKHRFDSVITMNANLSRFDAFRELIQDKDIAIKNLQAELETLGVDIDDASDFYKKRELVVSKINDAIRRFNEKMIGTPPHLANAAAINAASFVGRLQAAFPENDSIMDDLSLYMYAKHAIEYNARVKEMKTQEQEAKLRELEDLRDNASSNQSAAAYQAKIDRINAGNDYIIITNGSGMTDTQAQEIIDWYEIMPDFAEFDTFVQEFRKEVIDARIDLLEQHGLLSPDRIKALRDGTKEGSSVVFEHYVPLKVTDEAYYADFDPSHGGLSRAGSLKSIKGTSRFTILDRNNPITQALADYAGTIKEVERNESARALYNLIKAQPDKSFWDVVPSRAIVELDNLGKPESIRDLVSADIKANSTTVMINGKLNYLYFKPMIDKNKNPVQNPVLRAMLSNPLNNYPALNAALDVMRMYISFKRNLITTYNVAFGIPNFARDLEEAMGNIETIKQDLNIRHIRARFLVNLPSAMKAIAKSPWDSSGRMGDMWERAQKAGMKMSWAKYDQSDEQVTKYEEAVKKYHENRGAKGMPLHTLKVIADRVQMLNDIMENTTRLSLFASLVDSGVSDQKAASAAKNITLNFEKKGTVSNITNALWLFANAGIQGVARGSQLVVHRVAGRYVFNKRGLALGGGIAAFSFMNRMLFDLWDHEEDAEKITGVKSLIRRLRDDEDKDKFLSDFDFENNTYIFNPIDPSKPLKIPKPYSFIRIFMNVGENAYDAVSGRTPVARAMLGNVIKSVQAFVDPIGGGQPNRISAWTPEVLTIPTEWWMNKKWNGTPFHYKEESDPGSEKYTKQTPPWLIGITDTMNRATDFAHTGEGVISWSPALIQYIGQQFFGGVGAETIRTADLITNAVQGEGIKINDMTVVRRFMTDLDDQQQPVVTKFFALTKRRRLYGISDEEVQTAREAYKLIKENGWLPKQTLGRLRNDFKKKWGVSLK